MSMRFFLVTWMNMSLIRMPTISRIVNWFSFMSEVDRESIVPSTPGDTSYAVMIKLGSIVSECSRHEARLYVST